MMAAAELNLPCTAARCGDGTEIKQNQRERRDCVALAGWVGTRKCREDKVEKSKVHRAVPIGSDARGRAAQRQVACGASIYLFPTLNYEVRAIKERLSVKGTCFSTSEEPRK
jgi:hypothetical protein